MWTILAMPCVHMKPPLTCAASRNTTYCNKTRSLHLCAHIQPIMHVKQEAHANACSLARSSRHTYCANRFHTEWNMWWPTPNGVAVMLCHLGWRLLLWRVIKPTMPACANSTGSLTADKLCVPNKKPPQRQIVRTKQEATQPPNITSSPKLPHR